MFSSIGCDEKEINPTCFDEAGNDKRKSERIGRFEVDSLRRIHLHTFFSTPAYALNSRCCLV